MIEPIRVDTTLVPAAPHDFKNAKAALANFLADRDWIIASPVVYKGRVATGQRCSYRNFAEGVEVTLRFNSVGGWGPVQRYIHVIRRN